MGRVEINTANVERIAMEAREDALIRAAARVVVFAQAICPVGLTGHLRRSIERGDLENGAREIWVVASALYSLFVERGTGKHAKGFPGSKTPRDTPWVYRAANGRFYTTEGQESQPFLNPALDLAASEVL